MKRLFLPIIIFILVLNSCEYQPTGIYEVNIDPIDKAPPINVDLNVLSDTLFLPNRGDVNLNYSTNDENIKHMSFLLENGHKSVDFGNKGSFTIGFDENNYQLNTPYKLTIQCFRSSGSGSLADQLDQEGFIYEVNYTVFFVDFEEMAPQITKISPEAGSMKIEWEKFKGVGFKAYHVFNSEFYKIDIISDPNKTFTYDDSYIGYGGNYFVTTSSEADSYRSNTVSPTVELPVAWATQLDNGTYEIKWNKTKFENNVIGYKIYENINEFNYLKEIAFIHDLTDTSLIYDNMPFAAKTRFFVQHIAKEPRTTEEYWAENYHYFIGQTEDYLLGKKIPLLPYPFFYTPLGDNCYYSSQWLYKFNTQLDQISDSIMDGGSYLSVSPNGTEILTIQSETSSVDILNAANFSKISTIQNKDFPGQKAPYACTISNSDVGVVIDDYGNYFFYDFAKKETLAEFSNLGQTMITDQKKISNDGKFFCASHYTESGSYDAELYKLENGEAICIWTEENVECFDFDPIQQQFIYFKNYKLHRIQLPDFTLVEEIQMPDNITFNIDWNEHEFLSLNDARDLFSIRSLESGEVKKTIRTFGFDAGGGSNYHCAFLSNKTIFTSGWYNGLHLKLEYN